MDHQNAKKHLDTVIRKARVHLYKPIQLLPSLTRFLRIEATTQLSIENIWFS